MPFQKCLITSGFDTKIKILILFMIIDYTTGLLKAIYTKTLNSKIGAKGIIKKVGYIFIIIVASTIDMLFNELSNMRNIVIYMFITNETISILENWSEMDIKIPKILKENFKSIKNDCK